MLWRRECRKIGTGEKYTDGESPDSVLVRTWPDSPWVNTVFYTDFHSSGKSASRSAAELAVRAIESVRLAKPGRDGISYLQGNLAAGIKTPLTDTYVAEIFRLTKTESLDAALEKARSE